jgi:hypothetical protein
LPVEGQHPARCLAHPRSVLAGGSDGLASGNRFSQEVPRVISQYTLRSSRPRFLEMPERVSVPPSTGWVPHYEPIRHGVVRVVGERPRRWF